MMRAVHARHSEDYIINEAQWVKYFSLVKYAKKLAKENDGTIEGVILEAPDARYETVGVGVRLKGEITFGDASAPMESFREAVDLCDGFDIFGTGLDDGSFILSFYISDMAIPKR